MTPCLTRASTRCILEPKEGLALINGTSYTAGYAVLALWDAREIAVAAELATAMTVEALLGNASAFHPFIHQNKPHPGQVASAAAVRTLLAGSKLATSFEEILIRRERIGDRGYVQLAEAHRIQDKYSVRCAPHIIGILRDTIDWADRWVETEINSSTDNPLFDAADGGLHLGGNFYAGHVGQSMDSLKTAIANIADLLDRQLELVVDEKFNEGLPPNLIVAREARRPAGGPAPRLQGHADRRVRDHRRGAQADHAVVRLLPLHRGAQPGQGQHGHHRRARRPHRQRPRPRGRRHPPARPRPGHRPARRAPRLPGRPRRARADPRGLARSSTATGASTATSPP